MTLSIDDPMAERLARELARRTGESIAEAVTVALRERLDRVESRRRYPNPTLAVELDKIALRCAALPVVDGRCAEEILGFDEHGVPR